MFNKCAGFVFCLQLGPTSFRLYIKPQDPAAPRATPWSSNISLAGQGTGLQVLPGNVTEVVQVRGEFFCQLLSFGGAPGYAFVFGCDNAA